MEKVGLEGSYQTILVVLLSIISYLAGGLTLIAPYLFYQDPYICPNLNLSGQECTDYICSQPGYRDCHNGWYEYCPEPLLNSLTNKFGDFRCE